jgi:uncharacterized Ntn-hydrolase superfamily protein
MTERRISQETARRLLARAIEIDADDSSSMTPAQLHEVAIDAGISRNALDAALREHASTPLAPPRGRFASFTDRVLGVIRGEGSSHDGLLPDSLWRSVAPNAIGILSAFAALSVLLLFAAEDKVPYFQIRKAMDPLAMLIGFWVSTRLRARLASFVTLGLAVAFGAEVLMDVVAGAPAVRGGEAHFALIIAAMVGVAIGATLGSRSGSSAPAQPASDPRSEPATSDQTRGASLLRWFGALRLRDAFLGASALLALPSTSRATWSVVAVDMATGRIVIASATCVNRDDAFLRGVQAVIVPGKGVAACQASVDGTHANQMLVFNELAKGTDPAKIIEMLSADPAFQSRQFGIVDLRGRSAGHSGLGNGYVTQDIQGRVPGTQIYYSIQGNILRPGEVVPNAVKAFLATNGALTDRVMAAMDAADASGGDSRCTCAPPRVADTTRAAAPPVNIPCDGRTAYVAYITMAEPTDTNGDSHNNGTYAMYITVTQPQSGGPNAIRPGENLNPVKTLRMRYDEWRKTQPASFR